MLFVKICKEYELNKVLKVNSKVSEELIMESNNKDKKDYLFKFTEEDIAIIKAGLEYYWIIEDFGHATWYLHTSSASVSDSLILRKVSYLRELLDKVTNVKANFGFWGDIKTLSELLEKEYIRQEKEISKK